jgi:hypothetical protein
MRFSDVLSGRSDFASRPDVIRYVENSKNFDPRKEDLADAKALLLFSTSKQHTWLVSTSERLYCILDDIRKERLHINWSMPRWRLLDRPLTQNLTVKDNTPNTGLVDITEDHKDWLYTKRLFSDVPVEKQIADLVNSTKRSGDV